MRVPVLSGRFKRDVKRQERRGKDLSKPRAVLDLLIREAPLPPGLRDHPLRGNWSGFRDLHVEPDWLLLYKVEGADLLLARTGTHPDPFDE